MALSRERSSGTTTRYLRPRVRPTPEPSVEDMRWLAAVLLGLYSYVVVMLTLGDTSAVSRAFGITDRFYAMSEPEANVALFVPAGALLAVVLLRPLLAVAMCLVGSAAIEWTQLEYLTTRVADVNDVLHNGLGGLIGAVAAVPVVWLLLRRSSHRPVRSEGQAAPTAHPQPGRASASR